MECWTPAQLAFAIGQLAPQHLHITSSTTFTLDLSLIEKASYVVEILREDIDDPDTWEEILSAIRDQAIA